MKVKYFLSLLVLLVLMIFVMIVSGCFACFFDIPSLLLIVLAALFMLLSTYSFRDIGTYFSIGISRKDTDTVTLEKGILFFKTMQKYLIIMGVVGAMMGLIAMLATLDDPDRIGKGLALCLITVLYAVFFNIAVAIPFRTELEKQLIERT